MEITTISPRTMLKYTLKKWWVMVAMMVLGSIIGWLFSLLHPPVYETHIGFTITIDQIQTGPLNELEMDKMLWSGGYLLSSSSVLEAVVTRAQKEGINTDMSALTEDTSFERMQSIWRIIIRHSDPEVAFTLANIWGEVALTALSEAHKNALQTQALQAYLLTLGECLPYPAPQQPNCPLPWTNVDLLEVHATAAAEVEETAAASNGVFPALVFVYSEFPQHPAEPVAYGRNTLVLAGTLLGFWVSLGFVNLSVVIKK